MPAFSSFDTRGYPIVSAREGYALWSPSYEETVKEDMDTWLLEQVRTVAWAGVRRAADLGCGTGRTGSWLKARGVQRIDGIDLTPEMLEKARARGVFTSLSVADVGASGLEGGAYDLVTTSLVDEHLKDLGPLYRESARLAAPGGAHVLVGFHPFFIMRVGMPTHFDGPDGKPVAIETYIHLFSEHAQAAIAAGWSLAEMHEQVIDERWIAKKPKWAQHRDCPVSFLAVWRRA
ncbi:MAG TPA: class I SAM-dependent methyltransferase [Myxococcaceae bacterium]|nr:class I SAM-dependent methyltransferase [Myxococcaceae bacterium]